MVYRLQQSKTSENDLKRDLLCHEHFMKRPVSDSPVDSRHGTPIITAESTPSPSTSHVYINNGTSVNTAENTPDASTLVNSPTVEGTAKGIYLQKKNPTTLDIPGLTKSKSSPNGMISQQDYGSKLVIIMVGIPATGKSFISKKLSRYLNYSLYHCKVFNVGNTRRQYTRDHGLNEQDSKFFDPNDTQSNKLRHQWALDTLEELLTYLLEGSGSVAIFDATNTTRERRSTIVARIRQRNDQLKILFLESICDDKEMIEKNIQLKLFGPDYKGKDPERALEDFKERLENYNRVYEPLDDQEGFQYIKMINVGMKLIAYEIKGFLASLTMYYLLNFNLSSRQIWITRSGESEDNVNGNIGGNSKLTERGDKYARALSKFIKQQRHAFDMRRKSMDANTEEHEEHTNSFFVWTSMMRRAVETSTYIDDNEYPTKQMKMLDEINVGDIDGLSYPEFEMKYPKEYNKRQKDKLMQRFPGSGGESYMDVSNRLRTVITEVERLEDSILFITHHVVARILLGYFMNLQLEVVTNLDIPLHTVYCLEPQPHDITWSLFEYHEDIDDFVKVPKSELNITRVKAIGLVHKERHYSLVPMAPSSSVSS